MFKRFRHAIPFIPLLAVLMQSPARADWFTYPVVGPTDYYFTYEQNSVFKVRAYGIQYGIDSMLWLYNSDNGLVASNDDYYGLDSWIEVELQPGTYRLRAGVCCGNPDAWNGQSYQIETLAEPSNAPSTSTTTTSTTTTTSIPETTTTTSTTTTTTTTTIPPETTTTTTPEVTTTWPETTAAPATTTSTAVPVTTVPVETSVSATTVPVVTTTTSQPIQTVPTSLTTTTTSVAATTTSSTTTTTTVLEQPDEETPQTQAEEVIGNLKEMNEEEVVNAISELADADLTDAEAQQLVNAVQSASPEVREAFEDTFNVFSGQFDSYIPLNSKVDVGTRRVLVAATASAMTIAAPAARRKIT